MKPGLLGRMGLIATALALIGLMAGILVAYLLNGQGERHIAQATLAMLPGPEVAAAETPEFWEVLNAGQATRSAAIVLTDSRWLDSAALAAGVPKSTLTLTAGPIPQTTLITVTVKANSAGAAGAALGSVLNDAVGLAESVSGPFRLQTVTPPAVQSSAPKIIQTFAALGIAGLLIGAGAGVLISRSVAIWPAPRRYAGVRSGQVRPPVTAVGAMDSGGQPAEKRLR